MNEMKRKRLASAGYQSTTVADFLGLSAEQSELIEIKLALTSALKKQRTNSNLSQSQLAEQIGSSQSRIAKIEAGDPHVSLDLMIRALLAAGMTRSEVAKAMSPIPVTTPKSHVLPVSMPDANAHYKFKTHSQFPKLGGNSGDKKILGA